jgi:hypothetical protein
MGASRIKYALTSNGAIGFRSLYEMNSAGDTRASAWEIFVTKFVISVLILVQGALSVAVGDESPERPVSMPQERVTFYTVSLRCPLVEGLGCGSMAKPVLSQLEREPSVAEAWLDHSGTKLALVWKEDAGAHKRAEVVAIVSKTAKLNELSGTARETVLKDIQSGPRWY